MSPVHVAAIAIPVALVALVGVAVIGGPEAKASPCSPSGASVRVDPTQVPQGSIAGYGHEQLVNAAHVMLAASDAGLTIRDQQIGVMTAMGESGLKVLDFGDTAGPDSRGLFQQRANGAWGSLPDRMDPYISSTNFFKVEKTIEGRETLEPTLVANRVQRNADPYHYAKYWESAGKVVQGLAGRVVPTTGTPPATTSDGCGSTSGPVALTGWAAPAAGGMTSDYGPRSSPGGIGSTWHKGIDFGGGCEAPIWAANAGTVIKAGPAGGLGNAIEIDHGEGIVTRYGHMFPAGVLAQVGDLVTAGQQIGRIGTAGKSTGCHLHFEVQRGGQHVDPQAFLTSVGVDLEGRP